MMSTAQWDDKLIADLASECPGLCKAQMVGIRRLTTADQTRLLGHISDVAAVSNAT